MWDKRADSRHTILFIHRFPQLTKNPSHLHTVARFSPNGSYVASGDEKGLVRVWSPDHPEKILKKETPVLGGPILDIAWDWEGKRIVAAGNGGKSFHVKAFAFDTGSSLGEMTGHQKAIICCALRPSKPSMAATGSQDFKVGIYAGPPYKFVKFAEEHKNFVQAIKFSWDGSLLASVGSDTQIHISNGENGDFKVSLPGDKEHSGSIFGCAFSRDSKQLVTVGGDKTVKLWDIERGVVVTSITVGSNTEDMQVGVAWGKGGNLGPVSVSLGGEMNVIDWAAGSIAARVVAHVGAPKSVQFDSSTKSVYVGDQAGSVTKYSMDGVGERITGNGPLGDAKLIVAKNGSVYVSGTGAKVNQIEGTQFGASAATGREVQQLNSNATNSGYVAFVCENKAGIIKDGRIVGSIDLNFLAQGVALSPTLDFLVVGEKNERKPQARVYAVSDDCQRITATDKVLPELMAAPSVIAFSPDGTLLAVGDAMKEVSFWNGTTFENVIKNKLVYHTSAITCMSWSADSKLLVTGGNDAQIFIWNPAKLSSRVKIQPAHKGRVDGVDWLSADEIISVGVDGCVKKWRITFPL